MTALAEKTALALEKYKGKKLAVAVSGGRDSMCLLHAVINDCGVDRNDVLVIHVNHKLRAEADADMEYVRGYCADNGINFRSATVDVRAECAKTGQTEEQAARSLRYAAFGRLFASGECDCVLTAHHAADNAETTLMHIFRGAGLDGLRGIKRETRIYGGLIVRPMLDVYPSEIDEYAREHGIEFVTDRTNLCDDADRNFLRLRVIPLIESRYRGALRAVNALASESDAACVFFDGMLDEGLIRHDRGAAIVCDEALSSPLAARYVRKAVSHFSAVDLTRDMTERAVALYGMRTGATAPLNLGLVAVREYGGIAIYLPRDRSDECVPVEIGACFIDGLAVDVLSSDADPRSVRGGAVDLDAIEGAELRFKRDGDVFTPFGGRSKKLKSYFIDKKIPRRVRERTPLICRGNEVLVVVGTEVSEKAKQTDSTVRRGVVSARW